MKKWYFNNFKIIYIILLALSSCKSMTSLNKLSSIESTIKSQPFYESYLALEYLNFSRKLYNVKDYKTSEYFAKKGLNSYYQKDIIPENPLNWDADGKQIKEMIFMQKRLEEISSISSLRINLPIQLAHLNYLYDCWISKESSKVFQSNEIAYCKTTFSKLLEEMESYYLESKKDNSPKTQIIESKFERFAINFDISSSNLNSQASIDLKKVIDYISKIKSEYNLILIGNGDSNVKNLLDQNLANDRVNNIKKYLISNGIVDHLIEIYYEPENLPDIVTNDSIEFKLNRNVAIYVFNGRKNTNIYPLPILQNKYLKDQIKKTKEARGLK